MQTRLIAALPLLASLWLVSGCAEKAVPVQNFPPSADLLPPAKPVLSPEALTSDKALNDYDASVEAWGDAEYRQILRLCAWAVANGAKGKCQ